MANPWFRLYAEFLHDPKVQMLSEAMQRRYIMLMCMRCSNVTVTLRNTEIAFQLRISEAELSETKSLFTQQGFVDDGWNLLNWNKRQFISDHGLSGAERQQRHRDKVKRDGVTLRNVTVTLPDTDTDTDTEQKQKQKQSKSKPLSAAALLDAHRIGGQLAVDWIALRKTKKAAVTQTAIDGIIREADKAGLSLEAALRVCCERGWVGFRSEWMATQAITGNGTTLDKSNAAKLAAARGWADETNIIEGESNHVING